MLHVCKISLLNYFQKIHCDAFFFFFFFFFLSKHCNALSELRDKLYRNVPVIINEQQSKQEQCLKRTANLHSAETFNNWLKILQPEKILKARFR